MEPTTKDEWLCHDAISAAKAILSEPELSESTLRVAQALRSVIGRYYGVYDCFVRRRAELLVDAAIAHRIGCKAIIYYPELFWEDAVAAPSGTGETHV